MGIVLNTMFHCIGQQTYMRLSRTLSEQSRRSKCEELWRTCMHLSAHVQITGTYILEIMGLLEVDLPAGYGGAWVASDWTLGHFEFGEVWRSVSYIFKGFCSTSYEVTSQKQKSVYNEYSAFSNSNWIFASLVYFVRYLTTIIPEGVIWKCECFRVRDLQKENNSHILAHFHQGLYHMVSECACVCEILERFHTELH